MPRTIDDARFWDRTARKYAADVIADPAGYERTLECTQHYLRAADAVLEVGCGTGTTALRLAPCVASLVATDVSGEMIAIAREKAAAQGCVNAVFETARADAPDRPDGSFDVVLAFNVLHLVAARDAVLRNIHRLLKPGGLFISKTPCLTQMGLPVRLLVPVMQAIGKAPHVAFFTDAELEREITAAGFKIVERARHGTRGKDARPFLVARKRAG
jgi:ubiquinone/menaquinone biosynthesis C-methylase UbiE